MPDDSRFTVKHLASKGDHTPFSDLASEGDYGAPSGSVNFSPDSDVHLSVWSPVGKKGGRLVVFSHAEFLTPSSYTELLKHWASHGFVVVAPMHNDEEIVQTVSQAAIKSDFKWPRYLGAPLGADDSFRIPLDAWKERSATLKRVLDVIPIMQQVSGLDISTERPIIVGHSLGAFAAQLILGATARLGPADNEILSMKDDRYYAGMLLTPQGHGALGFDMDSWRDLSSPCLTVSGPGDDSLFNRGLTADDRTDAYALSAPNFKHLAWMRKTTMSSCTGEHAWSGVGYQHQFEEICAATTGFLKAYGDYDEKYLNLIAGADFENDTDGRLAMLYR
ncbi:hypothetical protein AA14337_3250 [Acetobacter malorum DSM 14337]|uniref:AB hydrolase-1 domain-containing protein n=1 Tax=Acetobacter malorum DSM 14337 TaxID=1307910 RepID=A0ABQ0Q0I7_9PROT|nr:hypothetical protein [Acetobacter malorum]GBQ86137.1 hypothetical protein AA14337_3250 [Acetobacter malorum DSM 14337]